MTITITGSRYTPRWETLQSLIRTMICVDGSGGRLTRIARPDGQCNYRAPGVYHCTFTPETGDDIAVVLEVRV